MKLVYFTILLFSISFNDIFIELIPDTLCEHYNIDLPVDSSNEKDSEETSEDDSKVDFYSHDKNKTEEENTIYTGSNGSVSFHLLIPFLELNYPPPED